MPATTFGAAFAADIKVSDKASGNVFLLPPDREQTPETIGQVTTLLEEGKKAIEKNEFDKAISKYQEAYGLAREIKYNDGEGQALTAMCLFYQSKGQLPRAKELGENALEVLADSTNKKALGQARAAIARVYLMQDNTYNAMQQLELAMQSFTDLGAGDTEEAAKVLVLAADVGMRTGHTKEALQFYEAAANYDGQAGKTSSQIALNVRVANTLIGLGFFTAALEEAQKALSVARNSNNPQELVTALNCVANCQFDLCEFSAARKSYDELTQIKLPTQTPLDRAVLEEAYAFSLAATGDTEQAKAHFEKALPVIKTQGNVLFRAQVYNGLGVISALQNNNQAAIAYFKQALDAVGLVTPKQNRFGVTIMQNLAAAQSRAGENRNAKLQLVNTLSAAHNKSFNDPLLEGRTYAALAEVCLNLKEYPEAEQAVTKGLEVAQKINDDAALWRLYTAQARIEIANQQPATEALTSAVSFFRSPQAGDFPDPNQLLPVRREDLGQELVTLLVQNGLVEPALLIAEQIKEESFINEWHRRGGEVRQADRDIYNDMVVRRAHLHSSEVTAAPTTVLKDWRDWLVRFQHVATENPTLARLIAPMPINLGDVVKMVASNKAVVLDYLVGTKSTILFTLDSNRKLSALSLPVGKEELQTQVASLLTASTKNDESARANEHRLLQLLYNELLPADAIKNLPPNPEQTVVVVPDSVLYNVPFCALLSPQGKFLVESHTLALAPALTAMLDAPHPMKDLSVLVAADKGGDDSESSQITSVFDPTQVITLAPNDAQVNTLQEQAKSTSIIHFASAVPITNNNPLHSEIPLATQHQEKVTANNLFELNLPSELAVLSASSVNAKDYRGNGVQVFCRGFNYAGVRNVLMSLWVEPDPARMAEIVEFYRGRQKGLSQAQSLRKAQLLALSKDPSPRSWAAFQLFGPAF